MGLLMHVHMNGNNFSFTRFVSRLLLCVIRLLNSVFRLCFWIVGRYEGQRDMLYNQTFNLDQVSFAAEGIKDAQQTVSN